MTLIDKYYKLIQNEKILLSYKGVIDSETVNYLVRLAEKNVTETKDKVSVRKKVINVLIETLQNVLNYFSEESLEKTFICESVLILTCTHEDYEITIGNYISSQRVKTLKKRIDNVNMMSQEDLQKVYLDVLDNPKVSSNRGAGLGLIDIVRRTKNKITYSFHEHDHDHVFFMMNMIINRVKNTVEAS